MESNTQRMNRVLLLWLELHRAVAQARSHNGANAVAQKPPWESEDAAVQGVWWRLTDPGNQLALEQWLFQSADGLPAEWARQALRACRERAGRSRSGNV
jgi:hypothetical protein